MKTKKLTVLSCLNKMRLSFNLAFLNLTNLTFIRFAYIHNSLVRVSRRDEPKNFVSEGLRHGLNPAECPKTYRERLPRPNPR